MDDKLYSDAERAAYKSPPCATCGSPTRVTWTNMIAMGDAGRLWAASLPECRNDACPAKFVG